MIDPCRSDQFPGTESNRLHKLARRLPAVVGTTS